jgi:fatty acid desaturase
MMEHALAVATSAIATEHFFTAFLSSPKASEHFFKPEEVREMFTWASIVSVCFAFVIALMLKSPWGFLTTLILIMIFYLAYKKAMGG